VGLLLERIEPEPRHQGRPAFGAEDPAIGVVHDQRPDRPFVMPQTSRLSGS